MIQPSPHFVPKRRASALVSAEWRKVVMTYLNLPAFSIALAVGPLVGYNAYAQSSITRHEFDQAIREVRKDAKLQGLGEQKVFECFANKFGEALFKPNEVRLDEPTFKARLEAITEDKQKIMGLECALEFAATFVPKGHASGAVANRNTIAVSDVILDYKEKLGHNTRVRGLFMSIGDYSFLYDKAGSTALLVVDSLQLPREDRKRLLVECSSGCNVIIEGRIVDVHWQKGIKASRVQFN